MAQAAGSRTSCPQWHCRRAQFRPAAALCATASALACCDRHRHGTTINVAVGGCRIDQRSCAKSKGEGKVNFVAWTGVSAICKGLGSGLA